MSANPYLLFFGAMGFLLLGAALIVFELLNARGKGEDGLNLSAFYWIQIASSILFGFIFLYFFLVEF